MSHIGSETWQLLNSNSNASLQDRKLKLQEGVCVEEMTIQINNCQWEVNYLQLLQYGDKFLKWHI